MKKTGRMMGLAVALAFAGAAALMYSPQMAEAAASSFKFSGAFTGIQAQVLAAFANTSTGHRHDGTDSRLVASVDTTASYTVAGFTNTGSSTLGDANADVLVSSGPLRVNAPATANTTAVVRATSTTTGHAVLLVEDVTGTDLLTVQAAGTIIASAGPYRLYSRSKAQLQAIVPGAVGESYYCSDCSPKKNVVSTGTSAGNFADPAGGEFK